MAFGTRGTAADGYTVVVPAYNAASTLPACLAALFEAQPAPVEIIVYDDGSSDGTRDLAKAAGATVIDGKVPQSGPAVGRNAGAKAASTSTVVFCDADVVVEADAPGKLAAATRSSAAAFGAYADTSAVENLAGRYANLRHHHTHMTAGDEAETFWSGLGAVNRQAFLAVGGFDERFNRPCVEDVELGLRLREAGGKIAILPDARGHHLKNWTLKQLWHTDIFCRALPWSSMIVDGRVGPTLNTSQTEQTKSVLAHLVWLTALAALLLPILWVATVVVAAAYIYASRRLLMLLQRDSQALAVAGAGLHWLYHCYASATFAFVLARAGFNARMRRRPAAEVVQAS